MTKTDLLEAAPQANELIYDAYNAFGTTYSFTERLKEGFIHLPCYSSYMNLGFNQGATLPDPEKLLKGKGNFIRHVNIRTKADLEILALLKLVRLAVKQGEEMAGSIPEKGRSFIKSVSEKKKRPL